MGKIGVVGAGSWGTALANQLAGNGHSVRIWDINHDLLSEIENENENKRYLPGIVIKKGVSVVYEMEELADETEIVLFTVPAQHFRNALSGILPFLPQHALILNAAKGIERGTLKRISEIAEEIAPAHEYAVLSGPSHAEEVGLGMPTTVSVASKNLAAAEFVQDVFMDENFRIYTNEDVVGLELGGSLKNIIALGAGISDGMGFGDNTKAALMTRGISEMVRLGVKLGAKRETFSGLSGIGDLIVTCTSMHSRNRRCGILIGEGMNPEEATKKIGMVVEGMTTAQAAWDLARKFDVEMPITESICKVINGEMDARTALKGLMTRQKRHEQEEL